MLTPVPPRRPKSKDTPANLAATMRTMMRAVLAAVIVAIATSALAAEKVNKGPWARNRFDEPISTSGLRTNDNGRRHVLHPTCEMVHQARKAMGHKPLRACLWYQGRY